VAEKTPTTSSFASRFSVDRKDENIVKKTNRVKRLKLFLPSISAILIGIILAWPKIVSQKEHFNISMIKPNQNDIEKLKMVNARFFGTDKKNQLYSLTSDTAEEIKAGSRIISLKNPKADILFSKGNFLAASAKEGVYNQREEVLELKGGIDIFHDAGYQANIEQARFDLDSGEISSDSEFNAYGPLGSIHSEGIKVLNMSTEDEKIVIFTNKAKLVLFF
jgi:lipopolysaccharide export system protein LptC